MRPDSDELKQAWRQGRKWCVFDKKRIIFEIKGHDKKYFIKFKNF